MKVLLFNEAIALIFNKRRIAIIFDNLKIMTCVSYSKTFQRHFEARATNVLDLVQSD